MRYALVCALFAATAFLGPWCTARAHADQKSRDSGIAGFPATVIGPHVVAPPKYFEPVYVPADVLLDQAEVVQPRTKEGWIVRNRPVFADCLTADPAARAYASFEYPLRLRNYESQIRLAQAEVDSWRRRLAVYSYFNKAGGLMVTVEDARLALLEATERLRNLRYEQTLFIRHHNQERHLQQHGVILSQEVLGEPQIGASSR